MSFVFFSYIEIHFPSILEIEIRHRKYKLNQLMSFFGECSIYSIVWSFSALPFSICMLYPYPTIHIFYSIELRFSIPFSSVSLVTHFYQLLFVCFFQFSIYIHFLRSSIIIIILFRRLPISLVSFVFFIHIYQNEYKEQQQHAKALQLFLIKSTEIKCVMNNRKRMLQYSKCVIVVNIYTQNATRRNNKNNNNI